MYSPSLIDESKNEVRELRERPSRECSGAVAHVPLHRGRVGGVTASAVEASEKNPRVHGRGARVLMVCGEAMEGGGSKITG